MGYTPPSPLLVLSSLQRAGPVLFEQVGVGTCETALLWGVDDAPVVAALQTAIVAEDRCTDRVWTDAYVCSSAPSRGSGRSVFVDGLQIKGVGKTQLASSFAEAEHDGRVIFRDVRRELGWQWLVGSRLGPDGILPTVAAGLRASPLSSPSSTVSYLLARPGTPLRPAHLLEMAYRLHDHSTAQRALFLDEVVWPALTGRSAPSSTEGAALVARLMERAAARFVTAQLVGLAEAYNADNADIASRSFDFEDVRVHGHAGSGELDDVIARIVGGQSLRAFAPDLHKGRIHDRHLLWARSFSYFTAVLTALSALDALAGGRDGLEHAAHRWLVRFFAHPDQSTQAVIAVSLGTFLSSSSSSSSAAAITAVAATALRAFDADGLAHLRAALLTGVERAGIDVDAFAFCALRATDDDQRLLNHLWWTLSHGTAPDVDVDATTPAGLAAATAVVGGALQTTFATVASALSAHAPSFTVTPPPAACAPGGVSQPG